MSVRVRIFDRAAFQDALGEADDDGSFMGPEEERPAAIALANRTTEGEIWAACLRRILAHPFGDERPALVGTSAMRLRLAAATATMPHFAVMTGIIARAIGLSAATGRPLAFPAMIALAPPGVGKSHFCGILARAIGTSCTAIAMNGTSDRGQLGGLSSLWRGAKMGKLARALIDCPTASPLYLLDELDKSSSLGGDNVIDVLLSALEAETARAFEDEYLGLPVDLSQGLFVASANALDTIPSPVLSRMLVVRVPEPTAEQSRVVIRSIAGAVIGRTTGPILAGIADQAVDLLVGIGARRVRMVLELACPIAVGARRSRIEASDVGEAMDIMDEGRRTPMGFLA